MIQVAGAVRKIQILAERSRTLSSLSRQGRVPRAVAASIRAILKPELTLEEESWIDRIEKVRIEINASTEHITRQDYGAGDPDSKRTGEQMRASVEVTESLGRISQVVSKPPFWCFLLFKLIRTVEPDSCIELGTAVGVSAAYQAAALKLNGHGSLVTLEGATSLASVARENCKLLSLDTVAEVVVGRFQDTLPDVLKTRQPVDYIFVDGHHDEQATLNYFEQTLPYLAETALLVFDDISWSEGMTRAWNAISHDKRVGVALDLGAVGLCVIDGSITEDRLFSLPIGPSE